MTGVHVTTMNERPCWAGDLPIAPLTEAPWPKLVISGDWAGAPRLYREKAGEPVMVTARVLAKRIGAELLEVPGYYPHVQQPSASTPRCVSCGVSLDAVLIRRERAGDIEAIRRVHLSAFAAQAPEGRPPVEAGLVDALRASDAWLPALSLVAEVDGEVVGHVVCTRGRVGETAALGLGPVGVEASVQKQGVGRALMHAVLGAADALDEPVVVLLGHLDYYPQFGFRPAVELGIIPPVAEWGPHFQARTLSAYDPSIRGEFAYAQPFNDL